MAKGSFSWQPEIISGMTTDAIVDKMKQLVPTFDLDSFVAKTWNYISCEDFSEEEYYPKAKFSDVDEDFIWMACEELWKRLIPNRPAVEHVCQQFETTIEDMLKAEEKQKYKEASRRSHEALDLICRHAIEETPTGRKVRREYYDKLRETSAYDFESLLFDLFINLRGNEEYEKIVEIAGIFGEGLGDDDFLDYKAESLFALGRKEEAERLYQEIIDRNPDEALFLLHTGDCYITYGEQDFTAAKSFYLKAQNIVEKHRSQPMGKLQLLAVYARLFELARDTADYAEVDRYRHLLDSLKGKKVGRNDPCPCGSGKKYKKCCGRDTGEPQSPPFDPRLMERDFLALHQQLEGKNFGSLEEMNKYIGQINKGGKLPEWVPKTPLEQAQSLIFEALKTAGQKRLQLAEQALKLSPDCADAYVLLAEEKAQNVEEASGLYEAGIKAAERVLGPKVFAEETGNFWGVVETRPYMRARAGLAQCLWTMGRQEEAINHYQELLKLNPNDNQGIRYPLAATLLENDKIDALQELLGQYDEPTADWLFTEALVAYVKQGDSIEARNLLSEALSSNRHVAPYLLGEKKLPGQLPEYVGFGDKDEAANYVAEFGNGWYQISGAVDWLASVSGRSRGIWEMRKKTEGVPEVFLKAFESKDRRGHPKKQGRNE